MTPEEKFDLISRYLDENLQEGDEARLDELLARDPGFAAALAELSIQHARLHRLGRTPDLVTHETVEPAKRRPRLRPDRPQPSPWIWAAAAAALLILAGIVFSPDPTRPSRAAAQAPRPPEPRPPTAPDPLPAPRPRETEPVPLPPPRPRPLDPVPDKPVPAPAPAETPKPPEPRPSDPPPPPKPVDAAPAATTVAVLARVERAQGLVFLLEGDAEKGAAKAGLDLAAGQGIRTGLVGLAAVRFPDGLMLELGPETTIREMTESNGKRVVVTQGSVTADVPKQTQPLVLATPNAEATVLGTKLIVTYAGEATRLDVRQGRVRLSRRGERASVEVIAGHYGVVAAGVPLASRTFPRAVPGVVALYSFDEGKGGWVYDLSGAGAPLDLHISDPAAVKWSPGSLALQSPALIASPRPGTKIAEACKKSSELSVEAWIKPARTTAPAGEEPGRIITFSADHYNRNFTLEQGEPGGRGPYALYNFRLRTTGTNLNGWPPLFRTPAGSLEARVQHVVYARAASGTAVIYLDGVESVRTTTPGTFTGWEDSYRVAIGDEFGGQRPWLGEYRFLAVYGRALGADEVKQRFRAGPE